MGDASLCVDGARSSEAKSDACCRCGMALQICGNGSRRTREKLNFLRTELFCIVFLCLFLAKRLLRTVHEWCVFSNRITFFYCFLFFITRILPLAAAIANFLFSFSKNASSWLAFEPFLVSFSCLCRLVCGCFLTGVHDDV